MNKDVIIICESIYHGNTMKLARAFSNRLQCRLITADEALLIDLKAYQIVGLASGIYFTSHHPKIMAIIDQLNVNHQTFIVSTRGRPYLGNYHAAIRDALANKGVEIIGEFSTKGYDCTGPFNLIRGGNIGRPNEKDQLKAIKFINEILPEYIRDLTAVPNGRNVAITSQCVGCGSCQAICPMNVFAITNNRAEIINEHECIHCSLCQRGCPEQAILIRHSARELIAIAKHHSRRKSL